MLDPLKHRASAATSDPAVLADRVAAVQQRLNRNPRHRLERATRPLNPAERFALAEIEAEHERFRNA